MVVIIAITSVTGSGKSAKRESGGRKKSGSAKSGNAVIIVTPTADTETTGRGATVIGIRTGHTDAAAKRNPEGNYLAFRVANKLPDYLQPTN